MKQFLPEIFRTLFIAAVTAGVTMFGTVEAMSTKIAVLEVRILALETELRENKAVLNEVRADLKDIQKLAAERGKSIPDLERRIERLESRR